MRIHRSDKEPTMIGDIMRRMETYPGNILRELNLRNMLKNK